MPKRESHPYTIIDPTSVPGPERISFRALLPLESPPLFPVSSLPSFPAYKPRPKWLREGWSHSTHIIPAAYPRSSGDVELPARPKFDPGKSKAERMQDLRGAHARLLQLRNSEPLPVRNEKMLWICVDRYVRLKDSGNGLTLFFAHANGLSKEASRTSLLSPWAFVLSSLSRHGIQPYRGFWTLTLSVQFPRCGFGMRLIMEIRIY